MDAGSHMVTEFEYQPFISHAIRPVGASSPEELEVATEGTDSTETRTSGCGKGV
jgi:hypothetical protein